MESENFARLLQRFASAEIPPWRTADGSAIATDGKIAIVHRRPPSFAFERLTPTDRRAEYGADIERWIVRDKRDAREGRREAFRFDARLLHAAACAAIDDAYRRVAQPDLCDRSATALADDMPVDFVVRNASVILPAKTRPVIAARYALTIYRAITAFGVCVAWCFRDAAVPGVDPYRRNRLLFSGAFYDILLMPKLLEFGSPCTDAQNSQALADAATGRLVHSCCDPEPADFDRLRFGVPAEERRPEWHAC